MKIGTDVRNIYINEDNHHFYGFHPPEDMTPEGVDKLVDFYAENTQVAGILFCVNVQRALFNSKVWETFYDDYDPSKGEDQICLKRGHGIQNMWLLNHRGIDYHARWLARCQYHGIEGWLSMRMNDCHGLEEHERDRDSACFDWPSTFWRKHKDLRRAPYRWERSWEGAFDYNKEEVREHHMKLITELLTRYDMYGLELDWMRWGRNFAPGYEQEGAGILSEFMRNVREIADENTSRVGHPIKISVRLPAEPQTCLALGYDVITWAEEGLIDMLTLSSMLGCSNFDYPIYLWRSLLGKKIKLLTHAEPVARPYPRKDAYLFSYELLFASAASALARGADGIYLFNECYRESDAPELLKYVLTHAGQQDTLDETVRRHAISYPQVHAAGESIKTILPIPLHQEHPGHDFGRMDKNITLRISIGKLPDEATAWLRLGFSEDTPELQSEDITVRINGKKIIPIALSDERIKYEDIAFDLKQKNGWLLEFPKDVAQILSYSIPNEVLKNDINVIEFEPADFEGYLVWGEILIIPENRKC